MLKNLMGRFKGGRAGRAGRGSVMPLFAVMSIPVLMSVGVGVDMTRMTLARSSLQSAVDGAAMAAAAAGGYSKTAAVADTNARAAANSYFDGNYTHGGQGPSVTLNSGNGPVGASGNLYIPPPVSSSTGYKVTVSAQGTMSTAFLGLASMVGGANNNTPINTVTIKATATANNQTTPGTGPTLVLNSSEPGSTAADWNTAYVYIVPFKSDGVTPDFGHIPKANELYLAGTNCPPSDAAANPTRYCHQTLRPEVQSCSPAGTKAFSEFPSDKPDQPIAMLFINVTNGRDSLTNITSQKVDYGSPSQSNMDYYGARFGSCQVFMTALLSLKQSPSKYADSTAYNDNTGSPVYTSGQILNMINTAADGSQTAPLYNTLHTQTTKYNEVSNADLNNCLVVISNIDPNAIPSTTPLNTYGQCFSTTDTSETVSGKENANLSCNKMAGRTYMYWFNDMGWYPKDDKDYYNLYFSFRCTASGGSSGTSGHATTPVSLMK